MKKWLVLNEKGQMELLAQHNPPDGAYIEAPEHYSKEMLPYITLVDVMDGPIKKTVPQVPDDWYLRSHTGQKTDVLAKAHEISKAMEAHKKKQKFNELKPIGRFFKSILGDQYEPVLARLTKRAAEKIGEPKKEDK